MIDEIKAYNKKRDAAVAGSLDDFIQFGVINGITFSHREVAEIAYHKSRTAILSLPQEMRVASDKWLRDRNYESWM